MDEVPFAPKFDAAVYRRVRAAFEAGGPGGGVVVLRAELESAGEFQALFYALLLSRRVELGLSPFPLSPATELPPDAHEAYEDAIRQAARHVGGLHLGRGEIAKAWAYFRIINEPGPVKEALLAHTPGPDDDIYPLVEIAWQQGVLPEKGFDLILDRSGVCSAITMVGSADLNANPTLRDYCVKRLVRALHAQLKDRLAGDLAQRAIAAVEGTTIPRMLADHPELMADDAYHIDTSHLSSVVLAAMQLPACAELDLARELALYGTLLSTNYTGDNDPPFEKTYADYLPYLNAVAGVDVEANVAHFKAKLPAAAVEGYRFPAEVVVNLLVKLDRLPEALAVAREFLADAAEGGMSCPGVMELARRTADYDALAAQAMAKDDPVSYLAALIAAKSGKA